MTFNMLLYIVLILSIILFFLVIGVFFSVFLRKRRSKRQLKLKLVIYTLMGKYFKNPKVEISSKIKLILEKEIKSKLNFHQVVKHLIDIHYVIKVPNNLRPLSIIKTLKIDERIEKELQSPMSFNVAQALRYSYKLGIIKYIHYFKKNFNSSKITIRREAQVGLVVFQGWDSLLLLNKITHPISLWQIIQVLDTLETHPRPSSFEVLEKTLDATNHDVVCLAIHCATRFGVNNLKDKITILETHSNYKVANLAKAYNAFITSHKIPVTLPLDNPTSFNQN